jgi:SOS-response transcriptional repressor LexA
MMGYRWLMAKKIEILPEWPQWKKEIAERLNEIDLSMKVASLEAGLGETFVRDALKRDKEPTFSNLQKVRQVIGLGAVARPDIEVSGLEVIGKAQAGTFLDISVFDDSHDKEIIPAPRNPKFPEARQYALQIIGDSMNKLVDDGSFVICTNWDDTGLQFKPGMSLHVERHQGSLVEVTVKRLALNEKGRFILEPYSTNPTHKAIMLDGDASTEIKVRGLVTGSWKSIPY